MDCSDLGFGRGGDEPELLQLAACLLPSFILGGTVAMASHCQVCTKVPEVLHHLDLGLDAFPPSLLKPFLSSDRAGKVIAFVRSNLGPHSV